MKGFFDRLFGRKQLAHDAQQKSPVVKANSPTAASFQPYQIGDIIAGEYEVLRVLGKGGFGIVYHIRFLETGEDFA